MRLDVFWVNTHTHTHEHTHGRTYGCAHRRASLAVQASLPAHPPPSTAMHTGGMLEILPLNDGGRGGWLASAVLLLNRAAGVKVHKGSVCVQRRGALWEAQRARERERVEAEEREGGGGEEGTRT